MQCRLQAANLNQRRNLLVPLCGVVAARSSPQQRRGAGRRTGKAMLDCPVSSTASSKAGRGLAVASKLFAWEPWGKGATAQTLSWKHPCRDVSSHLKTLFPRLRDFIPSMLAKFHVAWFHSAPRFPLCFQGGTILVFISSSQLLLNFASLQWADCVFQPRGCPISAVADVSPAPSEMYTLFCEMFPSVPGWKIYAPLSFPFSSWTEIWAVVECSQRTVKNSAYPFMYYALKPVSIELSKIKSYWHVIKSVGNYLDLSWLELAASCKSICE